MRNLPYGRPVDVYSFGVILAQMLTGIDPEDEGASLRNHSAHRPQLSNRCYCYYARTRHVTSPSQPDTPNAHVPSDRFIRNGKTFALDPAPLLPAVPQDAPPALLAVLLDTIRVCLSCVCGVCVICHHL